MQNLKDRNLWKQIGCNEFIFLEPLILTFPIIGFTEIQLRLDEQYGIMSSELFSRAEDVIKNLSELSNIIVNQLNESGELETTEKPYSNPFIVFTPEENSDELNWSFTFEDSAGLGIYIEFEGKEFSDVWAGD